MVHIAHVQSVPLMYSVYIYIYILVYCVVPRCSSASGCILGCFMMKWHSTFHSHFLTATHEFTTMAYGAVGGHSIATSINRESKLGDMIINTLPLPHFYFFYFTAFFFFLMNFHINVCPKDLAGDKLHPPFTSLTCTAVVHCSISLSVSVGH